MLFSRSKFECL